MLEKAAELLRSGHLVAFPTETVYGLGADATNDRAVAAIFAAKARPRFNPLIVHVCEPDAAARLVEFDTVAQQLATRFWPGPLTLVCRRRAGCGVSLLASAGLDTLAVRVPDHPMALALLRAVSCPVAAPSANRSGAISPTTAAHVIESLGEQVTMVLDGGPCRVGIESTVIDLSGVSPVLLRPGGIAAEAIAAVTGPLSSPGTGDAARSPGMMARHYAPGRPVRLCASATGPGEALLGFGPGLEASLNLSQSGDLAEAAANLFAMLRALDCPGVSAIAVSPIPEYGLGLAINDRLRRAAARD
ncbi:MAG: threonylcarbamoyl-AMP synthase [Alphaproteobacteria bacterium]|nr:threonylcarbamoyl-AMP synthase [Alphaproteobacteria bacterium]